MAASNLYQRNGTWYARLQINGRDCRRTLMTSSEEEARARLPAVMAESAASLPAAKMRLSHFIEFLGNLDRKITRGRQVYFAQREAGGPIKIGHSVSPKARIADFQTAHSNRLVILATIHGGPMVESAIHRRFAKHRLEGEWFRPTRSLRRLISAMMKPGDTPAHFRAHENGLPPGIGGTLPLSD